MRICVKDMQKIYIDSHYEVRQQLLNDMGGSEKYTATSTTYIQKYVAYP
jgi:hypothetical protein